MRITFAILLQLTLIGSAWASAKITYEELETRIRVASVMNCLSGDQNTASKEDVWKFLCETFDALEMLKLEGFKRFLRQINVDAEHLPDSVLQRHIAFMKPYAGPADDQSHDPKVLAGATSNPQSSILQHIRKINIPANVCWVAIRDLVHDIFAESTINDIASHIAPPADDGKKLSEQELMQVVRDSDQSFQGVALRISAFMVESVPTLKAIESKIDEIATKMVQDKISPLMCCTYVHWHYPMYLAPGTPDAWKNLVIRFVRHRGNLLKQFSEQNSEPLLQQLGQVKSFIDKAFQPVSRADTQRSESARNNKKTTSAAKSAGTSAPTAIHRKSEPTAAVTAPKVETEEQPPALPLAQVKQVAPPLLEETKLASLVALRPDQIDNYLPLPNDQPASLPQQAAKTTESLVFNAGLLCAMKKKLFLEVLTRADIKIDPTSIGGSGENKSIFAIDVLTDMERSIISEGNAVSPTFQITNTSVVEDVVASCLESNNKLGLLMRARDNIVADRFFMEVLLQLLPHVDWKQVNYQDCPTDYKAVHGLFLKMFAKFRASLMPVLKPRLAESERHGPIENISKYLNETPTYEVRIAGLDLSTGVSQSDIMPRYYRFQHVLTQVMAQTLGYQFPAIFNRALEIRTFTFRYNTTVGEFAGPLFVFDHFRKECSQDILKEFVIYRLKAQEVLKWHNERLAHFKDQAQGALALADSTEKLNKELSDILQKLTLDLGLAYQDKHKADLALEAAKATLPKQIEEHAQKLMLQLVKGTNAQLQEAEERNQKITRELIAALKDNLKLTQQTDQIKIAMEQLAQERDDALSKPKALEEELSASKALQATDAIEMQQLSRERDDAQAKFRAAEAELKALKEQLAKAENDKQKHIRERDAAQERGKKLEAELEKSKDARLKEQKSKNELIQQLRQSNRELEEQRAAGDVKLKQEMAEVNQLKEENLNISHALAKLQFEVGMSSVALDEKDEELKSLKEQKADLTSQLAAAKALLDQATTTDKDQMIRQLIQANNTWRIYAAQLLSTYEGPHELKDGDGVSNWMMFADILATMRIIAAEVKGAVNIQATTHNK